MGLPSWVYEMQSPSSEWEDKGIFLKHRRTGEILPKGISGGLPGLGKPEPDPDALSGPYGAPSLAALGKQVTTRAKEGLATLGMDLPGLLVGGLANAPAQIHNALTEPLRRSGVQGAPPEAPLAGPREDDPVVEQRLRIREDYERSRDRVAETFREAPVAAAVADTGLDLVADVTNLIPEAGAAKILARRGARELAEAAPRAAARVLPGDDISGRFASFLREKGLDDPDLYHDLAPAAQKAIDREFLAVDAGPQGASWGRFLDSQGLRTDDYLALGGAERAALEGEYGKLLPKSRQAAPGGPIPPAPDALPTPDLDRAAGGVATRPTRLLEGEIEGAALSEEARGLRLSYFGAGERGLTVGEPEFVIGGKRYTNERPGLLQKSAVYRNPEGKPIAAALISSKGDGIWRVEDLIARPPQSLLDGRAARAMKGFLEAHGAEASAGSITPDALRARAKVSGEAGFIRLGPGGPPEPPDPVLGAFHSEVFGKEVKPAAGEKLAVLGSRLQKEMVEAYTPLLKVARRYGPQAEDEIEVAIQRTRSASHTQMTPVLRFTEEYDPLANAGKGDWVKTGEPLTAVTEKLNPTERIEFESLLAAGSQVEFAARKAAAEAEKRAFLAQNAAERNMLRLLSQEQRRELRGLSYEAKALRAEELAATARGQRTLGRLDVLNRVSREGRRAGMELPRTSARQEAAHWAAGIEAEGAGAAAQNTEAALRRGIGDLSRDELRRYRQRLAIARPPEIPDLRLDVDPIRTAQAREVMRHAEQSGLLRKYEESLGAASIDRSGPGTGYRGWADRAWLRPAVGAGFITEADRVAILQKNQVYSLFQQIDTLARKKGIDMTAGEAPNVPRFLQNAPPSVIYGIRRSPLEKRMAGLQEGRQIAPVLEASAIQASRFQRLADRQLVKNKLADLVERTPELAPEIAKTTDPMAPGSFVAFRGGEKSYLQAPPDLLENLDRLTAQQAAFVLEAAQKATGALRVAATTYTPGFPFGNVARDMQRGWITSQHGMLPGEPLYTMGKEIVHRLFHKFEPSAMWREFDEGVASYSTFVKADSEGVNRAMEEAARMATGRPNPRRIVSLLNPLTYLRELGQFKESATRVTEKALAKKGGRPWFRGQANPAHVDPETGQVLARTRTESDLDAAKVSLNFMSGGSATREGNRYYAFLNAQALDAADFARQVSGPRKFTVIAKATAGITLPALYEAWHYKDDPRYKNLPWWDRSMFWHLGRVGDDVPPDSRVLPDGRIETPAGEILPARGFWDGTWRRIPKPQGLFTLVFGILPQLAFESVLDSNPKAAEEAIGGLAEQTPMQFFLDYDEPSQDLNMNLFPMVPDAVRPLLEAGVNRKGFPFGQAIDPRGTEETDPALRWNEQTPLWARELSERSAPGPYHGSVSPNRLQRVVEGYTAGAGKAAGGLVDRTLLAGREDPNADAYADSQEPLTPRDVPFLRSFMGTPAQGPGSAPVKEFWAKYDSSRQAADVLKGWDAAGRTDMARKAYEAHPELLYKKDFQSVADRLRELGKERKEVLAAPFHVLGPEQKRAYLELIDQGMTQVAGQLLLYIEQQEAARRRAGG